MQKSLLGISLVALLASCGNKKNNPGFELKGTFSNSNNELIFLEKLGSNGAVTVDSVNLNEKGEFDFLNYTPKIGFYRIKVNQQNYAMLVLDSADKVTVTGDIKDLGNSYKVEGSAETSLFIDYNNMARQREMRLDSLNKAFNVLAEPLKMDSLKFDSLSKTFEEPYKAIVEPAEKAMVDKILQNTTMYSSIMAIQSINQDKFPEAFIKLDEGLTKKFPNDKNVKMFHEMISRQLATGVGMAAPEISLPTPDGKELSLSSFKGKVVLIDFWASWCAPCRKEMPNVVKAYAKYKNKGFEIFGVSLDQDKDRWVEAIAKDGITWPQVSDLKQWGSEVVKLYTIQGIPFTVLLDKDGKIIAKNLRGEELDAKLAEVLK